MGTVFRLLGSPVRALGFGVALSALIAAGADAQSTTPIPTSRALVTLPENQVPNMRMQNFSGSVYERLAIRRGLVAAGIGATAIGGATWAGKELSARVPTATASTWRSVVLGGLSGAAVGAGAGCVAGAAAGLITAGALSGPGCLAAGFGNAIVGGFLGAYGSYVSLDEGGTIKIPVADLNALIKLAGSNANAATMVASTGQTTLDPCPSSYTDNVRLAALVSKLGSNVQFACQSSSGFFKVGQILDRPYKYNYVTNSYGVFADDGIYVNGPDYGLHVPSMTGYQTGTQTSDISYWYSTQQASQTNKTAIAVFINGTNHNSQTESFKDYVKTVTPVASAPAWASVLGTQINSAANQLKLSNEVLAGMLNAMHKQMTVDGSLPQGLPAYDPSDPITPADIQQVKNANPSYAPTIGDLSRPYTTPGREPVGGTISAPVAAPQDVNVVGGSTGTGTSGSTNVTVDFGPSGDTTMPAADTTESIAKWDQVTAALDPWKNLHINWPAASECPVYPIDVPNFFGRSGRWVIDAHCQMLPDGGFADALLGIFLTVVYSLVAVKLFLKA